VTEEQNPDNQSDDNPDDKPAPKPAKDETSEVEKWKALARKNEAQAKANADAAKKLAALEEAGKTESERMAERLNLAERERDEAKAVILRSTVAAEKGINPAMAKFLPGVTREELEASSDEYIAAQPAPEAPAAPVPGRPKERMRPGAVPAASTTDLSPGADRLRAAYANSTPNT